MKIGGWERIAVGGVNFLKFLIFQSGHHDFRQVSGCGVMFIVMQAVGIGEMGAGAAQLHGFGIHHLNESSFRVGDVFCNDCGSVIAGLNHQTV